MPIHGRHKGYRCRHVDRQQSQGLAVNKCVDASSLAANRSETPCVLGCRVTVRWEIFMGWVAANPEGAGPSDGDHKAA